MPTTRFSPFELLLLKSRNQTDTAALLLLAWVASSKGSLSETDRQRLDTLAAGFRHGHGHDALLDIARAQDLGAIQLAAEVLQKDRWGEPASPFLRQAIELAASDGKPSAATNHVLRFLADLLGTPPQHFERLFAEVAGRAFERPEDPSRADYWHAREHARQQQQERREREQSRQQYQHDDRRQQRSGHHERHRSHHGDGASHRDRSAPNDRTLRALHILGLEAEASRGEIKKAYRRLAQTHHPDRFFSLGERDVASASLRFQKIKKAYEYLMQDA